MRILRRRWVGAGVASNALVVFVMLSMIDGKTYPNQHLVILLLGFLLTQAVAFGLVEYEVRRLAQHIPEEPEASK